MNRLAKWMMRLYPAPWRKRYGDELDALLSDTGADVRTVADIARGGIRMQFSTWSFLKLAVVLGIVGVLAGLGYSLFLRTSYVAQTELTLSGEDSAIAASERLQAELTSPAQLAGIITDPALQLYADQRRTNPMEDVMQQMRRDLSITIGEPSKVSIRFSYPDRHRAEITVRILSANAAKVLADAHGPEKYPDQLNELSVASLPSHALRPDAGITGAAGLAIALLLAVPFRVARRRIPIVAVAGVVIGSASAWVTRLPVGGFLPLRYESHMTMFATHASPAVAADLVAQVSSRSVMAAIIADPRFMLYRDRQKTHDLGEIADEMRRDMTVTTHHSAFAQMFDISFVYSDRLKVQQAVGAVATRMTEAYEKDVRLGSIPAYTYVNWGAVAGAANPRIAVEAILPDREMPMLYGLAAGLSLAGIIALVRRRWNPEEEEPSLAQPIRPSRFSPARFRRLAFALTAMGVVTGACVAIATPARYVSEASFILHNADRWKAGMLVNEAIDRAWPRIAESRKLDSSSRHAPTLQELASVDGRFQQIDIRFMSDDARLAQTALDDTLGAIDHAVSSLRGTEDSPYDEIRGVDGALLPILAEHYQRPEASGTLPWTSQHTPIEGVNGILISIPEQYKPQPTTGSASVVSESDAFHAAVPSTAPPYEASISFDDARAKSVPQPESTIRMEVIDPPSTPTTPEGLGWWTIAIGATAGFVVAFLITLFSGFFGSLRGAPAAAPDFN